MRRKAVIISLAALVLILGTAFTYPLVATARDDRAFCLSCHVMNGVGQSHATSFHRDSASCSDCHTGSLAQKYLDGARHLVHNATGSYPEPITLRAESKAVVDGQCAACHSEKSLHTRQKAARGQSCLECHRGHDERPFSIPGLGQ